MKHTDNPVFGAQEILDSIDDYALTPERFLTRNYGRKAWKYDPYSGYYIVTDDQYTGQGRGFLIVSKDLHTQEWVLPPHHVI